MPPLRLSDIKARYVERGRPLPTQVEEELRRDERPGATTIREKLVDAILVRLDAIPVHLDLKEQGLFVLGYHHQRHALFNKPAAAAAESDEQPAMEGAAS